VRPPPRDGSEGGRTVTINVYALGGVITAVFTVKLTTIVLRYRAAQKSADRKTAQEARP